MSAPLREIDEAALEDVVVGSAILAAGGGGNPYVGKLLARAGLRRHGPVAVAGLDELPDDAQVAFVAGIGAPGVLVEKLPRAEDLLAALAALEHHLGRPFTHVAPVEAGGLNAVTPLPVAAARGIPVLDADGMGRAFPSLELVTPTLYGGAAAPLSLADEHGNVVVVAQATNGWSEQLARSVTAASGALMATALYPMTGAQAKAWLVRGVLTRAATLGRVVREARARHEPPVAALLEHERGELLFEGKVVEVERRTEHGWTIGTARLDGVGAWRGSALELQFQNEHLVAVRDGEPVATVPDLIVTVIADSAEPVPAEELRFGFRIGVLGLACDPHWRTPAGLRIAGPRAFGYDHDYRPVGGDDDA